MLQFENHPWYKIFTRNYLIQYKRVHGPCVQHLYKLSIYIQNLKFIMKHIADTFDYVDFFQQPLIVKVE